ncbi:alpha/beta hydrolase [Conexibacter sp. JD483]|uniref:alpha/beta fold hydrolase n=1 Tax=unclassified Conexibacter TaxID=2627773 RepID=UPI0027173037|nr:MULTISPECIES: alpha/beta hydrolase [unclassified Conexibacter]MDO8188837.1 alpha/beta hydrolase [Conexibacter sp. CPCC 205706]MDO8201179.1 alpha/beta hydrolase [Conexibacter sp. CPCC 205762]MDR9371906.1 alpha/beta hydrolase [Conexibacter sp. JD483]
MLVHDRRGDGPPLVLIHGIGARRGAWDPVVQRLTDRETFAVDTPGFGDAPPLPPGSEATMETYVGLFEQFFADLGLERPHVAGNSMGGGIALELARRGSVASATALSPIGFWNGPESTYGQISLKAVRTLSTRAGGLLKQGVSSPLGRQLLLAQMYGHPAKLDAAAARLDVDKLAGASGWDATLPLLGAYRFAHGEELDGVPVTVGWGTRDRLLLYRTQSARAKAALPHARHVPLPGCGHLPMWDDPEGVAALLRTATATSQAPLG